ncbi:hypothetical protein ADL00_37370 [Streptomyces sp. AS58]|uniref:hypothetical protein n=1 Tax=Streptomyces sp. AS58 TaxID=1519489 RepID=UPI0006AE37DE|nr:hypothetical protein [Streptomyces sp. AS58]KOV52529.1 hypothetical protein ADL00_37370 [Streptomyces sp. AS58]
MQDDRVTAELAREALGLLPTLVGSDAPGIAAEIHRALAVWTRSGGSDELRRVLGSDVRVRSWVEERLRQGEDRNTPGLGSGYSGQAGDPIPVASATTFVCKNSVCPSPDTWVRSFMGDPVPRCSGCTWLLSREA